MKLSIDGKVDKSVVAKLEEVLGIEADEETSKLLYSVYVMGQQDTVDNMREIYNSDPCEFEDFFHIE